MPKDEREQGTPLPLQGLLEHFARTWRLSMRATRVLQTLRDLAGSLGAYVSDLRSADMSIAEFESALELLASKRLVWRKGEKVGLTRAGLTDPYSTEDPLDDLHNQLESQIQNELAAQGMPVCPRHSLPAVVSLILSILAEDSAAAQAAKNALHPNCARACVSVADRAKKGELPPPLSLLRAAHDVAKFLAVYPKPLHADWASTDPLTVILDTNIAIAFLCHADPAHRFVVGVLSALSQRHPPPSLLFMEESLEELGRVLAWCEREVDTRHLRVLLGGQPPMNQPRVASFILEFVRERMWGRFSDYADTIYRRFEAWESGSCDHLPEQQRPAGNLPVQTVPAGKIAPLGRLATIGSEEPWRYLRRNRLAHDVGLLDLAIRIQQRDLAARAVIWTNDELLEFLARSVSPDIRNKILYRLEILSALGGAQTDLVGTISAKLVEGILRLVDTEVIEHSLPEDVDRALSLLQQEDTMVTIEPNALKPLLPLLRHDEDNVWSLRREKELPKYIAQIQDVREDILARLLRSESVERDYISLNTDLSMAIGAHGTTGVHMSSLHTIDTWASDPCMRVPTMSTCLRLVVCPHSVSHIDLPWALWDVFQRAAMVPGPSTSIGGEPADDEVEEPDQQESERPPSSAGISDAARAPKALRGDRGSLPSPWSSDGRYMMSILTRPRGMPCVVLRVDEVREKERCLLANCRSFLDGGVPEVLRSDLEGDELLSIISGLCITDKMIRFLADIDPKDLKGSLLVVHTGWYATKRPTWLDLRSPSWEAMHVWNIHPWLSDAAAAFLGELPVAGIATDAPMLDCPLYLVTSESPLVAQLAAAKFLETRRIGSTAPAQPVHHEFLTRGRILMEGLTIPQEVDSWYQGKPYILSECVLSFISTHVETDCALASAMLRIPT